MNDSLLQNVEQVVCPNTACEATISHSYTASNIDEKTGIRTVKALCPACNQMHVGKFRLRNGFWELIGKLERVTAPKEITGFKARVEHNQHIERATAA